MASIQRSAQVSYSVQQVFAVVNDVSAYPRFLPGCIATRVFESSDTAMRAEMRLGIGAVAATFVTNNRLVPPNRIELTLERGPFKRFVGLWTFTEVAETRCIVKFELDFKASNPILGKAIEAMLSKISADMVRAVEAELGRRYRN